MTQPTKVDFRFHEPETLADFFHVKRTRLEPQAHFVGCVLFTVSRELLIAAGTGGSVTMFRASAGTARYAWGTVSIAGVGYDVYNAGSNAHSSLEAFQRVDIQAGLWNAGLAAINALGLRAGLRGIAPNNGARLLPGEGAVGTYDDLIRAGTKGDNITPLHIPSANHMKQHGVAKGDGISINMEHPHPGSGGRHRQKFTYGTRADDALSPRDALGRGVRDTKRIYEEAELYGPDIRRALQELIEQNRRANPGLFD